MWSSRSSKSVMNVAIQYHPLATLLHPLPSLLQFILHQHLITCIPSFKTSWQTLMILSGNIWCYSVYKSLLLEFPFWGSSANPDYIKPLHMFPCSPWLLAVVPKYKAFSATMVYALPAVGSYSCAQHLIFLARSAKTGEGALLGSVNRFVSLRNCCRAKIE